MGAMRSAYFALVFVCYSTICCCEDDAVQKAIDICREKLSGDPHFPKVQHSLAQLLDSQVGSEEDLDASKEVVALYISVGLPADHVEEKRIPPPKVRFESLIRAAHISKDILRDRQQAISCYIQAIQMDGIDQIAILTAFEEVIKLLHSSTAFVEQEASIDVLGDIKADILDPLQLALNLCDFVGTKFPDEAIIDEFRGATLRRMSEPNLAFKSYEQAMVKSRTKYFNCRDNSVRNGLREGCLAQLKMFINTSILVAASARAAGINFDDQKRYLEAVDTVLEDEQMYRDELVTDMVDLYNNMGVLEKKRGSLSEAMTYFRKALELNPTDGHALVQIASISSSKDEDVIAQVMKLDPEYVSDLFDGYSSRFESELVDVLKYVGHELVYESLRDSLKDKTSISTIIDLGVGTGLLGELIATNMPWVAIHGTDLSQRMVDISLERKCGTGGRSVYASVSNLDASEFLSKFDEASVDSVLASDVFIYIGDISDVLTKSAKCLVENGLVGFTVESYETADTNSGLRLLPSGRFGHSKQYIHQTAEKHGFKVLSWRDSVLRQQAGSDVNGAVVILQKQ